jgi:hypothetical protein
VARAYLSAAINAYEQPAYASGSIDKSELSQVLPMILDSVSQPPAAVTPRNPPDAPTTTAPQTTAPLPSANPVTSPLPTANPVTSALPNATTLANRPQPPSGNTPTPEPTPTQPPRGEVTSPNTEGTQPPGNNPPRRPTATGATPPEDGNGLPGYPSLGPNDPKPAWWDAQVNGDRATADGLRRLVLDGRDFLNQVESIALTPEQRSAWNTWKAA